MLGALYWGRFRAMVREAEWIDPGAWQDHYTSWTRMRIGPQRVSFRVTLKGVCFMTGTTEVVPLSWLTPNLVDVVLMQSIIVRAAVWLREEEGRSQAARARQAQTNVAVRTYEAVEMPEGVRFTLHQAPPAGPLTARIEGIFSPAELGKLAATIRAMRQTDTPGTEVLTAHERLLGDDD